MEQVAKTQFCDPHWSKLRQAINDRGMEHLVAKTGQEAMARISNRTQANYEPLIVCHMMIIEKAMEIVGVVLGCPICVVSDFHEQDTCDNPDCIGKQTVEDNWINGAADDALTAAKKMGLIKVKN